jgi:hypothetical protein
MISIERYRKTRFWAVYDSEELVCVTAYKKGAVALKKRLETTLCRLAPVEVQLRAHRHCV